MKKLLLFIVSSILVVPASARGLDYDMGFDYLFYNAEFTKSNNFFEPSQTVHGVNFSPLVGLSFDGEGSENLSHRVMAGANIRKDTGGETFSELMAYYQLDTRLGKGDFTAVFGLYPRNILEGPYCTAFFSEYNRYIDPVYEGMVFKYKSRRVTAELGLDWLGQKSLLTRERFQILGSVKWVLTDFGLSFHVDGKFYHYACSQLMKNVVDNHMIHPYLEYNPGLAAFDRLSVTAGWIFTYQWDRIDFYKHFPGGFKSDQQIQWRGLGLRNDFYLGENLMPMYNEGVEGVAYAGSLYFGNLCYHTQIPGWSFYDKASIYYEKNILSRLSVRASFDFHLGNPTADFGLLRGMTQTVALKLDL